MAAHTVQHVVRIRTVECSTEKHEQCTHRYPGAVCNCPCHGKTNQLPLFARAA